MIAEAADFIVFGALKLPLFQKVIYYLQPVLEFMGCGALRPVAFLQRADVLSLERHALIKHNKLMLRFCGSVNAGYEINNRNV